MSHVMTCDVRGETILLDIDDRPVPEGTRNYELWRAETYTTKEPDTLDWVDEHVQAGDVLYDIGANIGQYALYAARRVHCEVLAFEPEALNFAKLNRNIVVNELSDRITAYCLAIAARTALETLYVQRFTSGASLHAWGTPQTQGERPFEPQHRQGSMGVTLDDLTGTFGLRVPDLIKIDVDGIEEQIVAGAPRTLADPRLRSVIIEVFMHEGAAERVIGAFERAGMRLGNRDAVSLAPGTAENLVFVR